MWHSHVLAQSEAQSEQGCDVIVWPSPFALGLRPGCISTACNEKERVSYLWRRLGVQHWVFLGALLSEDYFALADEHPVLAALEVLVEILEGVMPLPVTPTSVPATLAV